MLGVFLKLKTIRSAVHYAEKLAYGYVVKGEEVVEAEAMPGVTQSRLGEQPVLSLYAGAVQGPL